MKEDHPAKPNWLFVSRSLAAHYGSDRVVLNGIDPAELCFSAAKGDYFLFLSSLNRPFAKGLDFALSVARSRGVRLIVAGTATTADTISESPPSATTPAPSTSATSAARAKPISSPAPAPSSSPRASPKAAPSSSSKP